MKTTWLEICKKSLLHNIIQIKKIIGKQQLGMVIKANAYGHGLLEIAHIAQESPEISWLFTASSQEAIFLRLQGISKPIQVLAYCNTNTRDIIENNLILTIGNQEDLIILHTAAKKSKKKCFVHLKIDTGLSRLGFYAHEVISLVKNSKQKYPWCAIQGLLTHLADVNNADPTFTHQQLEQFNGVITQLLKKGHSFAQLHALASGSLWLSQQHAYSLVRVGTCLYGLWKSPLNKQRLQKLMPDIVLYPVLSWKARIIQIYTHIDRRQYAVIPVGYVDGYPRSLAGKAYVLINQHYALVTAVDAQHLHVDITKIAGILTGDEVILMGNYLNLRADDLAHLCNALPHEFTTRISPLIERILIIYSVCKLILYY
ncbi:MAG: alanine racemase [Candidatus Babeliaceae bacterium]